MMLVIIDGLVFNISYQKKYKPSSEWNVVWRTFARGLKSLVLNRTQTYSITTGFVDTFDTPQQNPKIDVAKRKMPRLAFATTFRSNLAVALSSSLASSHTADYTTPQQLVGPYADVARCIGGRLGRSERTMLELMI
jgi:hypothetical protein